VLKDSNFVTTIAHLGGSVWIRRAFDITTNYDDIAVG
jgi:hypothetical protein